jgi:hypothetical protein
LAKSRAEYIARIKRVPLEKRVYVDESGTNTFLQREYARAPRGEKIEDARRGTQFERVNVIGGLCAGKHLSIECYKRATNSTLFERS